jgi:tRNA 2-selenouridine synthase
MHLPTFTASEVLQSSARIIDLRSPTEFQRDHMPGAINVPLLDDEQRALVGTLYARESPKMAFERGLEIAEARMEEMMGTILGRSLGRGKWISKFKLIAGQLRNSIPQAVPRAQSSVSELGEDLVILHCWRGGMRSQSVAMLLRALGEEQVAVMEGGYKAYRATVMQQFSTMQSADLNFVVLRGEAGAGKTAILRRLEERRPNATLDLEGLAQHRSSVLGAVGLHPVSQPRFETLLLSRLGQLFPSSVGCAGSESGLASRFVEGESRKVGNAVVPSVVFAAIESAPQVRLMAPLEYRIELLGKEYLATPAHRQQTIEGLKGLRKKLGRTMVEKLASQVAGEEWRTAAATLLEEHYDPLYRRDERGRKWFAELDVTEACFDDHLDGILDSLRVRTR